jgi:hypothetical protein
VRCQSEPRCQSDPGLRPSSCAFGTLPRCGSATRGTWDVSGEIDRVAQPEQAVLRSNKKLLAVRCQSEPRCPAHRDSRPSSCAFGTLPRCGSATRGTWDVSGEIDRVAQPEQAVLRSNRKLLAVRCQSEPRCQSDPRSSTIFLCLRHTSHDVEVPPDPRQTIDVTRWAVTRSCRLVLPQSRTSVSASAAQHGHLPATRRTAPIDRRLQVDG